MNETHATLYGALIGVGGGLIGTVIGAYLTGWFGHRQFLTDNKKAEYRSLLDSLGKAVREIRELKTYYVEAEDIRYRDAAGDSVRYISKTANLEQQVKSALLAAEQAIEDRFFIQDALTKNKIKEEWKKLEQMALLQRNKEQGKQSFNQAEFDAAWVELAQKIGRIAEKDILETRSVHTSRKRWTA